MAPDEIDGIIERLLGGSKEQPQAPALTNPKVEKRKTEDFVRWAMDAYTANDPIGDEDALRAAVAIGRAPKAKEEIIRASHEKWESIKQDPQRVGSMVETLRNSGIPEFNEGSLFAMTASAYNSPKWREFKEREPEKAKKMLADHEAALIATGVMSHDDFLIYSGQYEPNQLAIKRARQFYGEDAPRGRVNEMTTALEMMANFRSMEDLANSMPTTPEGVQRGVEIRMKGRGSTEGAARGLTDDEMVAISEFVAGNLKDDPAGIDMAQRAMRKFRDRQRSLGEAKERRANRTFTNDGFGAIGVDRKSASNVVADIAAQFEAHESFILALGPEGTRGYRPYWRSGFYHIARAAGVPIVPIGIHAAEKRIIIGPPIDLTGDVRADMDRIRAFYAANSSGIYPDKASPVRLREEVEGEDSNENA